VRAELYALAALPSEEAINAHGITAGALYEYHLDHLEVRDREEAANVRRVVRECEL
jgi:hypothetical protein